MLKAILGLVVAVLIGAGIYYYIQKQVPVTVVQNPDTTQQIATTTPVVQNKEEEVIGKSAGGKDITAYHFGTGDTEVVFIGGIHGGYEWNTALVAYQLRDYLKTATTVVPANVKVTVIPVANPDGLSKVVSKDGTFAAEDVNSSKDLQVEGRYNGNNVDLNRNFDCDWQAEGTWQTKKVSGGTAAFSEPEAQAIKSYIESAKPAAVVVWFSAAGGVYSSNCHDGVLPETTTLNGIFSKASGYPSHENFDYYAVTGDIANWLSKAKVPSISVLLTDHTRTEWDKNRAGVEAILKHYQK